MIAMMMTIGTLYPCNPFFVYDCNVEIRRTANHCNHIWPFLKEIAIIYSPFRN